MLSQPPASLWLGQKPPPHNRAQVLYYVAKISPNAATKSPTAWRAA